mmetsp:Transcript_62997/g.135269  ORF Transcript_62997/g.135269 Transcript_62997/m.135269 type:complete len:501 (-) Transcript_62997:801-2303(-)
MAACIPDAETLTCPTVEINLAACGAVEASVPNDNVLDSFECAAEGRGHCDGTPTHALTHIVIALSNHLEMHALDVPHPERLASCACECKIQFTIEALVPMLEGNGASEATGNGAIGIGDLEVPLQHSRVLLDEPEDLRIRQEIVVQGRTVIMSSGVASHTHPRCAIGLVLWGVSKEAGKIHHVGLCKCLPATHRFLCLAGPWSCLRGLRNVGADVRATGLQQIHPSDDLVHRAVTQGSEDCSHLLRNEEHEVCDMLGCAGKLLPQLLTLRCNAHRATVHVTNTSHDATLRDHCNAPKSKLLSAHHSGNDDVPSRLHAPIHTQRHTITQAVLCQHLLHLRQALFPRASRMHDAAQWRSAGAAVMARDLDHICVGLGHARGDGADARTRDEFHRDFCLRADLVQVVDELRQILDGVNVMVGRRGDELDTGHAVPEGGNVIVHLWSWELAALARLRALGKLDLELLRADEVRRRHPEPPRRDLLCRRGSGVSIPEAFQMRERR